MHKKIGVIRGDCSSHEIVDQTLRVLDFIGQQYGHEW